jgi:hypothetical protein
LIDIKLLPISPPIGNGIGISAHRRTVSSNPPGVKTWLSETSLPPMSLPFACEQPLTDDVFRSLESLPFDNVGVMSHQRTLDVIRVHEKISRAYPETEENDIPVLAGQFQEECEWVPTKLNKGDQRPPKPRMRRTAKQDHHSKTSLRKKGILLCPLPLQDAVLQLMDKCLTKFVPVASCFLDPYLVDRPKAVPPSALWNRADSTGPEESPQATSRGTSGRTRQVSHPTSQPTPGLVVAGIARIADLPALAKNLTSSSQPYLAQEGFRPAAILISLLVISQNPSSLLPQP